MVHVHVQANAGMDVLEGREEAAAAAPASAAAPAASSTPAAAAAAPSTPAPAAASETPAPSTGASGFSTGPIHFMGPLGLSGEATATIHVQTEGQGPPPPGLAEAISAMVQQAAGGGGEGGSISLRLENGRVVREGEGAPAAAEAPAPGPRTGGAAGGSSIRHPPPSVLAEVLELYNTAQARLATHSPRLLQLLRDDPTLGPEDAVTHQTFYNNYSSCQHFLAHAQHAMSDIMLHLAR